MNKMAKTKENSNYFLKENKMFTFNSEKNEELIFDLMYLDIYDEDVMYCMTC